MGIGSVPPRHVLTPGPRRRCASPSLRRPWLAYHAADGAFGARWAEWIELRRAVARNAPRIRLAEGRSRRSVLLVRHGCREPDPVRAPRGRRLARRDEPPGIRPADRN